MAIIAENVFHRPLAEITEEELLRAVHKQFDGEEAYRELLRRGWKKEWIV